MSDKDKLNELSVIVRFNLNNRNLSVDVSKVTEQQQGENDYLNKTVYLTYFKPVRAFERGFVVYGDINVIFPSL